VVASLSNRPRPLAADAKMLPVRRLRDSGKSEGWVRIGIRAAAVGVAGVRDVSGRAGSESCVATVTASVGDVSVTLLWEGFQLSV
jgi:hypothetical protein